MSTATSEATHARGHDNTYSAVTRVLPGSHVIPYHVVQNEVVVFHPPLLSHPAPFVAVYRSTSAARSDAEGAVQMGLFCGVNEQSEPTRLQSATTVGIDVTSRQFPLRALR